MGIFYSFLDMHVNSINAKKKKKRLDFVEDVRFSEDKELKGGLGRKGPCEYAPQLTIKHLLGL